LSFLIWLIIKPYFVDQWNYKTVLIFVSLTSFPAILYAIPVERFYDLETAATLNVRFLLVVAAWRLCLLYFFIRRISGLGHGYIIVATLLPVVLIIVALTALNLERAVFDVMGGFQRSTANDDAYQVLVALTVLSVVSFGPLILAYVLAIRFRWKLWKRSKL